MPYLCIQVHPHRSPALNLEAVRAVCEALTRREAALIHRFDIEDGTDGHYYADLIFETRDTHWLWRTLWPLLYATGGALEGCSIATCEGNDGWKDYLLLYHFDPHEQRDELPDRPED